MAKLDTNYKGFSFPKLSSIKVGDLISFLYPASRYSRDTSFVKGHGIVVKIYDKVHKDGIVRVEVVNIKTQERLTILNGFVMMENEVK